MHTLHASACKRTHACKLPFVDGCSWLAYCSASSVLKDGWKERMLGVHHVLGTGLLGVRQWEELGGLQDKDLEPPMLHLLHARQTQICGNDRHKYRMHKFE